MTTLTPEKEVERLSQSPWITEAGFKDAADLIDMGRVGQSLIEAISDLRRSPGWEHWMPADGPAEIVFDLLNALADAQTANEALSALPPPVPTEEGGENLAFWGWVAEGTGDMSVEEITAWAKRKPPRYHPTQAPQDVAGLVEGLTAITAKLTAGPFDVHSAYMIRALRGDLAVPLFEARAVYGDPALEAPGLSDLDGGWVYRKNTTTARAAAAERQAHANVHALADLLNALPAILALLRTSPTREVEGFVEAAADDNREALVTVPREPTDAMVREGSDVFANRFGLKDDILVLPMTVQGVYRAMIAAFQSRQERQA